VPDLTALVRTRLADLGERGRGRSSLLRRVPPLHVLLEWAARLGYGARGFVYLSAGLLILLAALGLVGDTVGVKGSLDWLAMRPLGRVWVLLVGLGLAAFVMWRVLQSVFDADHEGTSRHGLSTRMSQAFSGFSYAALSFAAFGLLIHAPEGDPALQGVIRSREQAATVLSLPFGKWLLTGVGLAIFGIGVANIVKAWREDFTEYLACSAKTCRRVAPLARIGHVARGLAYLPLAVLVVLAGLGSSASDVTSLGAALEAVERQPAGPWILVAVALGFIAFGAFSFIEARFRRIRPPRDLNPMA
jgi:succinate dehydrogenase hydrophobic anchor subunit